MRPLNSKERLVLMDGLRGLALFGILLVNLRTMGAPSMAYGYFSIWSGGLAKGAELLSIFLFDGAFWTLFALLFGAGFSVMMGNAGPRTRGIGLWAYYRRLFLIGVFGVLHVLLLWWGDILVTYALAGMFLPLFRRVRVRVLLIWSAVFIAIPTGIFLLLLSGLQLVDADTLREWSSEYATETNDWVAYLIEAYRSSDFLVVARARLYEFGYELWYAIWMLPTALGVMLAGMAMAKQDVFRLGAAQDSFYRKLFRFAIIPAVVGKLAYLYGFSTVDSFAFSANAALLVGAIIGGLASSLVFLSALRIFYQSDVATWLKDGLVATGRMALTLYLMQSFLGGLIFYGYGLGLYAMLPPYVLWILGVAIFAGQIAFARFWFERYRKGPLEFILRRFTYL